MRGSICSCELLFLLWVTYFIASIGGLDERRIRALNGQSRLPRDRPLSGGGDIRQLMDEIEKQQLICKGKSKFFTRSHGL